MNPCRSGTAEPEVQRAAAWHSLQAHLKKSPSRSEQKNMAEKPSTSLCSKQKMNQNGFPTRYLHTDGTKV